MDTHIVVSEYQEETGILRDHVDSNSTPIVSSGMLTLADYILIIAFDNAFANSAIVVFLRSEVKMALGRCTYQSPRL